MIGLTQSTRQHGLARPALSAAITATMRVPLNLNLSALSAANGWRVMMMIEFKHKDEWSVRGTDFMVQVTRHTVAPGSCDFDEGEHRWAVYAYIYPRHPHFAIFVGDDMWQEAAAMMPLHGGPTYLRRHFYDGKECSIQVGADYHHLNDSYVTHYATKDDAREVFLDAESLFNWLQERSV